MGISPARPNRRVLALLLLAVFWAGSAQPSLARPSIPVLQGPVTDLADLLSPEEEADLEARVGALEAATGAQVAVLTVSSLEGEPVESFAIEVARAWGLGQAERDNGLLIVVAEEERELRIEVGRGLEGAVTDLVSKRIIDERMVPRFRDGDFGGGIVAAVEALDPIIRGEPMPELATDGGEAVGVVIFMTLFFLVIAVLGLAAVAVGGAFASTVYLVVLPFSYFVPQAAVGDGLAVVSLLAWLLGFPTLYFSWGTMLRSGKAGTRAQKKRAKSWFDDWSGGTGGRGGGWSSGSSSSGGGFSGGGGSFGGGGASGKW